MNIEIDRCIQINCKNHPTRARRPTCYFFNFVCSEQCFIAISLLATSYETESVFLSSFLSFAVLTKREHDRTWQLLGPCIKLTWFSAYQVKSQMHDIINFSAITCLLILSLSPKTKRNNMIIECKCKIYDHKKKIAGNFWTTFMSKLLYNFCDFKIFKLYICYYLQYYLTLLSLSFFIFIVSFVVYREIISAWKTAVKCHTFVYLEGHEPTGPVARLVTVNRFPAFNQTKSSSFIGSELCR